MVTLKERMLTEGISLESRQEWKDSPTTKSYTDFSRMDLDAINLKSNVNVEADGLVDFPYDNFINDASDPMLAMNSKLYNLSKSIDISGDCTIKFDKNDSVIGILMINILVDSKISVDLGKYKFMNLLIGITVHKGVRSEVSIMSEGSGLSYVRIKQSLASGSNLYMLNRHIKDGFLFIRGDADLEEGAELHSKLYLYADGKSHYDAVQNALFTSENGKAVILGKGIVNGESTLIFRGVLNMYMEKCYGSFDTKTLNLSAGRALADSVPVLDVGANNVTAKHSSSIENIDKDKLFYLMARGLDKEEGEDLIIDAFLDSTVN